MEEPLILCATDLSDEGDRAVDLAIAATRSLGGRLALVHAVGPEVHADAVPAAISAAADALEGRLSARRDLAKRGLEAARARVEEAGVTVTAQFFAGTTPADAILKAAEELEPSLLVLGRRHRDTGFVGQPVDQISRQGPCPMFVAPPDGEAPQSLAGAHWLVGADFSDHALGAVRAARALIANLGGEVTVVSVVSPSGAEDVPYDEQTPQTALREQSILEQEAQLSALAEREIPGATALTVRSIDRPSVTLDRVASEQGVDAIIVGTHGRKGVVRFILGSTAERLLRISRRPVLVVRDCPAVGSPFYVAPKTEGTEGPGDAGTDG
ncbi:MAG: universal stress protein [Deltaproteobacteria bacterium]|nr:universal stress protein [Deltaproteobacteria bacterium]